MSTLTLRVHNQGDRAVESGRYDVACLAERSPQDPPETRLVRYRSPLKGLAIDVDPDVLDVHEFHWRMVHPPVRGRSPARGTMWVKGTLLDGTKVAVMCAHRINDRHGEHGRRFPKLANRLWLLHAAVDARIARRLIRHGYEVAYGADINDHDADLAPLVRAPETYHRDDAIAVSPGARLQSCHSGPREGSDHASYTAVIEFPGASR